MPHSCSRASPSFPPFCLPRSQRGQEERSGGTRGGSSAYLTNSNRHMTPTLAEAKEAGTKSTKRSTHQYTWGGRDRRRGRRGLRRRVRREAFRLLPLLQKSPRYSSGCIRTCRQRPRKLSARAKSILGPEFPFLVVPPLFSRCATSQPRLPAECPRSRGNNGAENEKNDSLCTYLARVLRGRHTNGGGVREYHLTETQRGGAVWKKVLSLGRSAPCSSGKAPNKLMFASPPI